MRKGEEGGRDEEGEMEGRVLILVLENHIF
jgi:hypothetical protein